jgi:type II secretion system protein C
LEPPLRISPAPSIPTAHEHSSRSLQPDVVNSQAIVQANIFGGRAQGTDKSPKETRIDLDTIPLADDLKEIELVGTIISSDHKNLALIKHTQDRKPAQIVTKGERIKDIELTTILRNNVIVRVGDQEKVISIDYKARNLLQKDSELQQETNWSAPGEQKMVSIDREYVLDSLSHFRTLFQHVQILPYMKQGQPHGFQINHIKKGSFFDQIHLQNHDVLMKAENEPLTSARQIWDLAQQLQDKDNVQLQILRNNQTINYQYNLK